MISMLDRVEVIKSCGVDYSYFRQLQPFFKMQEPLFHPILSSMLQKGEKSWEHKQSCTKYPTVRKRVSVYLTHQKYILRLICTDTQSSPSLNAKW